MIRKITLITCIVFFIALPCFATDYYIKNGGNDGSAGTSDATAWANLDKIRTATSTNDTVYLKCGDTWEDDATSSYGAIYIEDKNITVSSYYMDGGSETEGVNGDGRPVVDQWDVTDPNPNTLYPDYVCLEVRGSAAVTVKNLKLRGGTNTSTLYHNTSGDSTYENLYFEGHGWYNDSLVKVRAAGTPTFQSCFFDVTTSTIEYASTIQAQYGGLYNVFDSEFKGINGNVLRAVQGSGSTGTYYYERNYFHTMDGSGASNRVTWTRSVAGASGGDATWIIRNNVIDFRNAIGSIKEVFCSTTNYNNSPNFYYINNTIVGDSGTEQVIRPCSGTCVEGSGQNHYFENNIVYGIQYIFKNPTYDEYLDSNVCYYPGGTCSAESGDGNIDSNTNFITTNPNIADPTFSTAGNAQDAQLTVSSSNAIDSGTGTPGSGYIPDDDYNEYTRTGTMDIGAFNYPTGDDGSGSTPPTIQGITITGGGSGGTAP